MIFPCVLVHEHWLRPQGGGRVGSLFRRNDLRKLEDTRAKKSPDPFVPAAEFVAATSYDVSSLSLLRVMTYTVNFHESNQMNHFKMVLTFIGRCC